MDKLNIMDGVGFPLCQDDIDYLQTAVRNAMANLAQGVSQPIGSHYIIKGCVVTVTAGVASVTAGLVVLNGEVCQVDAHTFTDNDNRYWYFDVQNAGTNRAYTLSGSHYPWQVRKAKMNAVPHATFIGAGFVAYLTAGTYVDAANVIYIFEPWQTLVIGTNWNGAGSGVKYRRERDMVQMSGKLVVGSTSGQAVGTLPAAYWPSATKTIPVGCELSGAVSGGCFLEIDTAGNLTVSLSGSVATLDHITIEIKYSLNY